MLVQPAAVGPGETLETSIFLLGQQKGGKNLPSKAVLLQNRATRIYGALWYPQMFIPFTRSLKMLCI